jgi:hypothetical protein
MHVYHPLRYSVCLVMLLPCGFHQAASAQGKNVSGAACTAVHGALLMRTGTGGWQSVTAKDAVPVDRMVVALFGAEFQSINVAVGLKLVADVGHRGPFPVLEAAAIFHVPQSADLDVSLDRGIAIFRNEKKSGTALVHLRIREEVFEVTLHDAKSRLGVEVYGRHVPGPSHLGDAKKDDPVANVVFFALEGEVVISNGKHATRLQAPPGVASYLWDNMTRTAEVKQYDALPDSVKPMNEDERKQFAKLCQFALPLAEKPGAIDQTLRVALRSKDALERKVAVVALGALDDLPGLVQAMNDADHADVREEGILVLRHWLGRAPGQSVHLYNQLTTKQGYTPIQAKSLLHLCYGIDEAKRRQPTTYELLIQALNHSKIPMRELAHWHLIRLAPDGKSIPYDAAAAEPQRLQAIEAWRRYIPEGELPKKK